MQRRSATFSDTADRTTGTLGVLFPVAAAPGLLVADTSDRRVRRSAGRRDQVVHHCEQGLLATPAWGHAYQWLSGTVTMTVSPDGTRPGWIAAALAAPASSSDQDRGRCAAAAIVGHRLGARSFEVADLPQRRIIVSTVHDDPAGASARLATCLARHDAAAIVLLVSAGDSDRKWRAVLDEARSLGVATAAEPGDPWQLLDGCTDVYGPSRSRWVLLGRLAGAIVYADDGPDDSAAWATAALVTGVRYADPFHRRAIEVESALDIAVDWHRHGRSIAGISACLGISFWKRERMRQFLSTGRASPAFSVAAAERTDGAVAAWASRIPANLAAGLAAQGRTLVRIEDGFIRSRGLGSNFLPPCSVVLDWSGQYVDPAAPSDLERLLAETEFAPALLQRARRLIDRLVTEGVTKYGGGSPVATARLPAGRRIVLVPGQVGDDLSVRFAGCGMDNAALLTAARAAEPDAFIIYKPHPDVIAGHRPGRIGAETARLADRVVEAGSMHDLLSAADAVHTITSLAGFEAILRGREVVTYGQPFYAGWGLTTDRTPVLRRQRRLSVDALAAGALLLYPRYVDPVTGMPCPAEVVLDRMADPSLWTPGLLMRLRAAQGWIKSALDRHRSPFAPQRRVS